MSEKSEILTPEEAAELLKTNPRNLKNLARQGRIPAKKVGNQWRFNKGTILKWFDEWEPNTFDPNKRAGEIIKALNGET